MRWRATLETLKAAVPHAAIFGIIIEVTRADEALKELDQTFVLTKDYHGEDLRVDFQNPSLVDVMLRYLNSKVDSWGDILLRSARYFNQLDFAFTTRHAERSGPDYLDYRNYSVGSKISLSPALSAILRSRMLAEFETLGFTAIDTDWDDQFSQYSSPDETRVSKLIQLSRLFDPSSDTEVREFVCNHFRRIEEDLLSEAGGTLAKAALKDIPQLAKIVNPFLVIDSKRLVARIYKCTTFVDELLSWSEFKAIYPTEYDSFVKRNLPDIRRHIRHLIVWDAEWYSEESDDYRLDQLFDWEIDEVLKLFGMRKTKALIREAEEAAGISHDKEVFNRTDADRDHENISEELEERFDEARVRTDFANLVPGTEHAYLEKSDVEAFVALHLVDLEMRDMVLEIARSESYESVFDERLPLLLLCKHARSIVHQKRVADDLLINLTKAELLLNLTRHGLLPNEEAIVATFGAACFEYYFGRSESFDEILGAIYRSMAPSIGCTGIDDFYELLLPFFEFNRQGANVVCDRIGRIFATLYHRGLSSDDRTAFYCGEFVRFSEENYATDWWETFLRYDRVLFVGAYFAPVGEAALAPIIRAAADERFQTYLNEMGLSFNMVLGVECHEPDSAFSMKGGAQLDFLEYFSIGLDPVTVGEFLQSALTESEAESLANEVVYFKDVAPDHLPDHPDARMVRINFGELAITSGIHRILQRLGETFGFARKFEDLRHEFERLLADASCALNR